MCTESTAAKDSALLLDGPIPEHDAQMLGAGMFFSDVEADFDRTYAYNYSPHIIRKIHSAERAGKLLVICLLINGSNDITSNRSRLIRFPRHYMNQRLDWSFGA